MFSCSCRKDPEYSLEAILSGRTSEGSDSRLSVQVQKSQNTLFQ